ncbi:MAG: methylornithine synthase PylB [Actinobacteria bacterium]|nr:methylornithine synthase PylB [Actinomycetota bacterium]
MGKNISSFSVDKILDKAVSKEPLSRSEILFLLGLKKPDQAGKLFNTARKLRQKYFGDSIFLYGFLYLSTYCQNNCTFCHYRASNSSCSRYRKTYSEVLGAAADLADSGVNLLDLTTGEDPVYYGKEEGFGPLLQLLEEVKNQTSLPVMASFGSLPDLVLDKLHEAGADWFACYQETHNKTLFRNLRLNQDYDDRLEKKYKAAKTGLLIEEGILSGVGESLEDVADSIKEMKKMNAHQVRVMNFIPQRGTPMQNHKSPPEQYELVIIAVLRLLFPDRLIPASLDVYGVGGLKNKLDAGANVVTSIILPQSKMAGVAQSYLDISEGYRTVKGITPILDDIGLTKAAPGDYISWIENEKKALSRNILL